MIPDWLGITCLVIVLVIVGAFFFCLWRYGK